MWPFFVKNWGEGTQIPCVLEAVAGALAVCGAHSTCLHTVCATDPTVNFSAVSRVSCAGNPAG